MNPKHNIIRNIININILKYDNSIFKQINGNTNNYSKSKMRYINPINQYITSNCINELLIGSNPFSYILNLSESVIKL